jgi:hypothetical protein
VRAAIVILLLGAASLVQAAPAQVSRATVEAKLRTYQPEPGPWRALGAGTEQALIAVAGDGKTEIVLRARAVSTLAYFNGPAARKFLEATVDGKATSSDPGDRVLVRKAAVALGWLGGSRVPDKLAPLLDSQDPDVRLDAAVGLGLTRLPAAAEPLRKRLDLETDARVRTQISRQIQVIDAARPPRHDAGR